MDPIKIADLLLRRCKRMQRRTNRPYCRERIIIIAFLELNYFSHALGKQTAVNVILPESDIIKEYETLYLFHGLSDNRTMKIFLRCVEVVA